VEVPPEHTGTAPIYIGGFSGTLTSLADSPVVLGIPSSAVDCYATGDVVSYGSGTMQYSGGFIGYSYMNNYYEHTAKNSILRCYAAGSVTAVNGSSSTDKYRFAAGGLVGFAEATDISECYAAGSVNAVGTSAAPVSAGGLVGYLGDSAERGDLYHTPTELQALLAEQRKAGVTESYALGNVLGDSASGTVYSGGLVGYMSISTGGTYTAGKIEHNFAVGSITAQSSGSGVIYAGGVVGYKALGTLENNAGRGERITVKGGAASRAAGRIFGASAGGAPANNYSLKTTYLGTTANYYDYAPPYAIAVSSDAADKDGFDKTDTQFRTAAMWTTAPVGGLGFGTAWNMAGVMRGYPKLAWQK
jgi:hypothetical protein